MSQQKADQFLAKDVKTQLIKVMLADGAFGHKQPLDERPWEFARISESEKEIERLNPSNSPIAATRKQMRDKLRQLSLIVQQKKVFLCQSTEGGDLFLGLAAHAIREGDAVTILRGSKVPIPHPLPPHVHAAHCTGYCRKYTAVDGKTQQ